MLIVVSLIIYVRCYYSNSSQLLEEFQLVSVINILIQANRLTKWLGVQIFRDDIS